MKHLLTIFIFSFLSLHAFAQKKPKAIKKKDVSKQVPVKKSAIAEKPTKMEIAAEPAPLGNLKKEPGIKDCTYTTIQPPTWVPYLTKALQPIVDNASASNCPVGQYRITVRFIVDETGKPTNPEIVSDSNACNFGTFTKAIILKGPNWPVAKDAYGNPIKSIQQTTIMFLINNF